MELVAFITTELEDDLIVSFAVQDPTEPTEIESLTLLRQPPRWEALVPPEERGVSVSFDRFDDDETGSRDLLEEIRFSKADKTMHIKSGRRSYDLDLRKVDRDELADMRKVLRRMNRDGRFRCVGL